MLAEQADVDEAAGAVADLAERRALCRGLSVQYLAPAEADQAAHRGAAEAAAVGAEADLAASAAAEISAVGAREVVGSFKLCVSGFKFDFDLKHET